MPTSLAHYIYVSTASHDLQLTDLDELLETCRRNNAALGVTGLLLYMGGRFFQILEGHPTVLANLYEKITRDPRHSHITMIINETIPVRAFEGCSMGFVDLSFNDLSHIHVQNGALAPDTSLGNLNNLRSTKLIEAFCTGSWGLDASVERKGR